MTITPDVAFRRYSRATATAQAEGRVPALSVALTRADRPLWTMQIGDAGGVPLDADTRFRIGSVTKTFTAVLVLQCRDAGLLGLDDPVSAHVPVPGRLDATIRQLLTHTSGMQREPFGDVWDTLVAPDDRQFLADLARAERVLAPARRYHYSNLAFALLGQVVAAARRCSWADALGERLLRPLGLEAITVEPTDRAATGYLVDEYSDHARPEPAVDFRALAPAAQLWGTAADLARWAAFLADPASIDPAGAVLASATLEEMRWPQTVTDNSLGALQLGLGLMILNRPDRVVQVGHYGAMPGFLAGAFGQHGGAGTPRAFGCAVLGSAGGAVTILELTHQLLDLAVAADPADVPPWRPGEPAPEQFRSVLGRWWSEGFPHDFRWREGRLEARMPSAPANQPASVFAQVPGEPDLLRTVSGRELGELLRLTRDASGAVVRMRWATYRYTRTQETFDGVPVSHP
ncbi:serine hydrolase domain-containing protein [Pilimelia columellifera]|uniref:serine hydrolase domain-containing protein n=1 Tax=Pilimelia columellifera TaxID=706574 RepID=UPI0031D8631C